MLLSAVLLLALDVLLAWIASPLIFVAFGYHIKVIATGFLLWLAGVYYRINQERKQED